MTIPGDGEALDRRGFLTRGVAHALGRAADALAGRLAPSAHVRPPGALPEAAFLAACTRCDACAGACPVQAIAPLDGAAGVAAGTPVLDVAVTACAMCPEMPCAAACPTGALAVPADGWRGTAIARITIDEGRCITWRGVTCGVCVRVCPVGEQALRLDGGGHPRVGDACTGCGSCIAGCVTDPTSIHAHPLRRTA